MREITNTTVIVPEKNDARPFCQHSTTETISVRIGDYEINARCTRYELEGALKQLQRYSSPKKTQDAALAYIKTMLDAITLSGVADETRARIDRLIVLDYKRAYGWCESDSTQDRIDCALSVVEELEHFLKIDPVTGIHLAL